MRLGLAMIGSVLWFGCAHFKQPEQQPRVFDTPVEQALEQAVELLGRHHIAVHPIEGNPLELRSEITTWDSSLLSYVPENPQSVNGTQLVEKAQWIVVGRSIDAHHSMVQIYYARLMAPESRQHMQRTRSADLVGSGPIERPVDAAPLPFVPYQRELAAQLDASVAVETLAQDQGAVQSAPPPPEEVSAGSAPPKPLDRCGIDTSAIDGFFAPRHVLLLGDNLGTDEAPSAFAGVACAAMQHGLPLVIALGMPATEQVRLNNYLTSEGTTLDRQALVRGPFWESIYPDGSSSLAMVELLDQLRKWRQEGRPLTVVAIDTSVVGNPREAAMAARVAKQRTEHPDAFVMVFSGNVHVKRVVGTQWDTQLLPMGYRLGAADPEGVMALDLAFDPGQQWVCRLRRNHPDCTIWDVKPGPYNFETMPVAVRSVRRFSKVSEYGYDATWYVGQVTASLPASPANVGAHTVGEKPQPPSRMQQGFSH